LEEKTMQSEFQIGAESSAYHYPIHHSDRYHEYIAALAQEEKIKSIQHLRKMQSLNFLSRSAVRLMESLPHHEAA
jgi:hypothetical protein